MRLRRLAVVLAWSLLLLGETCGTDIDDKRAGEPCTRASECEEGLTCRGGICTEPPEDGGVDAGD